MNTSEQQAYNDIQQLVNDFKANEQYYLSLSYQEKEVRSDFIDKFFIALGWDVLHNEQKSPYAQEVKLEKGVEVSGAQKRADYSFSLAPDFRNPKFFVEAKKPAHDLNNADYYFQTIRYGWHKATPLAVLTDFEQFHILDCRFEPDINTILNRKIKQYHYSDYTDKEKFAEIYWLFSREAVTNNSLEKYADGLPKLKGKAAKKALLSSDSHFKIDEAFLIEIDGIREKLAKAFKKNDDSLNSEELTEATQRTIDCLVFIRFLEDKEIEQKHYVYEFGVKGSAWHDFISLCRKLDAKYNGIVFKKIFIDADTFKGPADNEFYNICQGLCHLKSRFLYNQIPIYILGSIYERFLGKVVNATAQRVKIEEKPEVRKAGGVYYTPKYIVDYIVQNTVGKLIEGKTSEQIAQMRFADIACGSGSFLISVFDCLLDYHNKYYQKFKAKAKDDGCIEKDGIMVLSIKQKQKILQNNIYGVDIDAQAVEVTQLSLYLKLLEDETTATANEMQVLFHEKILPDMSKNIICGNSLIGTDILTDNLFAGNEERKLNPMDFESAFPKVFKSKTEKGYNFIPDIGIDEDQETNPTLANDPMKPYKKTIKGGFDAIIGNPPYLSTKRGFAEEIKINEYLKKHYKSAVGQFDAYSLFIERAVNLLKSNTYWSYIIPKPFLTNENMQKPREILLENGNVTIIADFGTPFKDANVEAVVIVLNKSSKKLETNIEIFKNEIRKNQIISNQTFFLSSPFKAFLLNLSKDKISIFNKMENDSLRLDMLCSKFVRGVECGKKDTIINKEYKNGLKKLLKGEDVTRYSISFSKNFIDVDEKNISKFKTKELYETERKLLIRRVGNELQATLDTEGYWNLNTIYNIHLKNIKYEYLLGLINSKLISFWFKNKYEV